MDFIVINLVPVSDVKPGSFPAEIVLGKFPDHFRVIDLA
jgi:hypothetical protein